VNVVVVGAGVSGLTAARELVRDGHQVVVVEARDRLGGRTWTAELGGAPADLGGSWIHGPFDNPLVEVVRDAGLGWHNDGAWGGASLVHVEGVGSLDGPDTATAITAQFDFDPAEAAAALGGDGSYDEGVAWFLDDRGYSGTLRRVVDQRIRFGDAGLNTAGPPGRVSLAGVAGYVDHSGGNVAIEGGYRMLVDHLAAGLDVRRGEQVHEIAHDAGGVAVTTTTGRHEADQVVITVPLGVLRVGAISITPPIPTVEHAASRLAMGNLEKVVLRFDRRCWPDNVRRLAFVSDHRRFTDWVDITAHSGVPTLVAFHNPTLVAYGADRVAEALDVLSAMVGPVPQPIAAYATDWTNDPFAQGSYSYIPVGGSADDMRSLAGRQSPRVVLAGEHTVPEYFGTVHGAYVSGLRAAAEFR
jgi:polyamine oxidase